MAIRRVAFTVALALGSVTNLLSQDQQSPLPVVQPAKPSDTRATPDAPTNQPKSLTNRRWSDLPAQRHRAVQQTRSGKVGIPVPPAEQTVEPRTPTLPLTTAPQSILPERLPAPSAGPPIDPMPVYPPGSFVTQPVQVYTRVRIEDRHKTAPGAIPMVISVKDPTTCRKRHCVQCENRCVYVQIWVPPCPLRKFKIEDYGAEIELDYGEYEIDIESEHGYVKVDYDD